MDINTLHLSYSASGAANFLDYLAMLSAHKQDGGMIHGGHIHFIQQRYSDELGDIILKAAIYGILERVPTVFPFDLPERVEQENFMLTQAMNDAWHEINASLILPISGDDITAVIQFAREYVEAK